MTSVRNTRTNTYQITIDMNSDSSHLLLEKEKFLILNLGRTLMSLQSEKTKQRSLLNVLVSSI